MTEIIRRLAIVNRGEPAMRALNAVAELNDQHPDRPIRTIAVHTDPDAQAWFVRAADEAISLGPATVADPVAGHRTSAYLDEERVVAALTAARVDAVWVGWGFVAEHASFARRCEEAGIVFVGPDNATIRLLGDKIAAKRLAEQADVPVVPWSGGPVPDPAEAAEPVARLGYPVVVKAAAGGGGRGIRIVRRPEDLADALRSARAEAELVFGDPSVFLERFIPAARHVEVQVIADRHGTTWAVGVRDCSVQRRNQKVIEESASTALDDKAEQAIREAAVRLVSAAGYRNAGTVEFLVDPQTSEFMFMEVNTRLQVEHPVTEQTTGLDLVKLQLYVACGGRLEGEPPPVRGHAVEARLCAEDPESGFSPAPGRIALLRLPAGPGIRVDCGITEGDTVAAEFDSMIAKVVAWGRDRDEAIARLRRALAQSVVVVEGGTTNRSFLLSLLGREEVRAGRFDNRWLDRLTADGGYLPEPEPVALLQAAIEAYDADQAAAETAFHAGAARGRPEVPEQVGHRARLRYRGNLYRLGVYRSAQSDYHVELDGHLVDVQVDWRNGYERGLTVAGRSYRTIAVNQGTGFLVDVDGITHRIARDDGGVVRAGWPAFVLRVLVAPGDEVAEGDPVVVLESMKMESTLGAPFGGQVTEVSVAANSQVDAGAPLLRIREAGEAVGSETGQAVVDFTELVSTSGAEASGCEPVYAALRSYLLGYDLPPVVARQVLADQRRLAEDKPADPSALARCEDELLDLFADVAGLYRPHPDPDLEELEAASPQEYLLSYLQWLDADRAGLPAAFRGRLERALARYGVTGLQRTAELERAVLWMFRSFRRVGELVPAVNAILQRRLRDRHQQDPGDSVGAAGQADLRARLDRLAAATQDRYQLVADLTRDVVFHHIDEPVLERRVAEIYADMDGHLAALAAGPDPADREALIERLVRCPQPMRAGLLRWWRQTDNPHLRAALLETHVRRFYRYGALGPIRFDQRAGHLLCATQYELGDERVHLVVGYAPLTDIEALARDAAGHLADAHPDRPVVVDLVAWREGDMPDNDAMAADLADRVAGCDFGHRLHRLDVTATSLAGLSAEYARTQHVTFRESHGEFAEDPVYRNLHPMLAERIELWRLSNFSLQRLLSPEDVFLFRGVAHANPKDVRLFAMAEVRDMTPARDEAGRIIGYPGLERIGLQALAAMRSALAAVPHRDRPQANRIVLNVRPPWEMPRHMWATLADRFGPLAAGVGLQKVVLRVRIPENGELREAVVHMEGLGERGGTTRVRPPGDAPIRPLTEYRQKVLRAQRVAAPYPYELIRMLTPPPGSEGTDFPAGRFVEHDLDSDGRLVPVDRPYGQNSANLVVGLTTNYTAKVPEGMTRVAILGDPTRSLGALAEPECRRIIAALDLAERERLPLEWFALSSGARIAMDSGTENMDWIGAVLRRIIEFTQAGGEVNVVVTGINVGAQPYWNAEATMLQHTRGILVMTPASTMVLTGKQALDFSGGVSAEDNAGIGGYERIMGPNGQGQYWAPDPHGACDILLRHYEHAYVVPGERFPRRASTTDPVDRDVRGAPHAPIGGSDFTVVGDVFSPTRNAERKKPFDIRSVMRSVVDADATPLERWGRWRAAETAVVWDAHIGGIPVCLLGLESRSLARRGYLPADGPPAWTSGTLFPQSSRKVARALNAASGNRPVVVLANLSGFDGSPESMRRWQLEYGAEIGRAVTNFRGPVVFVVVSRYHGGAFVVFSKRLNEQLEIAAVEGSYASVIGGAPAAAVVFVREVKARAERDPRIVGLRERLAAAGDGLAASLRSTLQETYELVRAEKLGEVAAEFDRIHSIQRAQAVGSVDRIIPAARLRPYIVDALERGMARTGR